MKQKLKNFITNVDGSESDSSSLTPITTDSESDTLEFIQTLAQSHHDMSYESVKYLDSSFDN